MINEAYGKSRGQMIITGASGFIGAQMVTAAQAAGWSIHCLGRTPVTLPELTNYLWHLGEPIPDVIQRISRDGMSATVVVHCAHDWNQDVFPLSQNANYTSTRDLLDATRAAGIHRFIFVSSQSARPNAATGYGRCKYAIEKLLTSSSEIAARIGFVYGGDWGGPVGVLMRALKLSPIVPIVASDAVIFPVHIDDACAALLSLASGGHHASRSVILAPSGGITFREFLSGAAKIGAGRRHVYLPNIPSWVVMAMTSLPFFPDNLSLRIQGLLNIQPFYYGDATILPGAHFRPFPKQ
jgi:NADH dehydrogenase